MGKKKLAAVSFTPGGQQQLSRVGALLEKPLGREEWEFFPVHKPKPLGEWCKQQFEEADGILFVGAMGIAVRTIAPFLKDKTRDPAVLVMDEGGAYVISVLAGHIGGGNELARHLARGLSAEPVITTASDVKGKIAIDVFAKKNSLHIADMELAKQAAAAIVAGKPVSFSCDGRVKGGLPKELSADSKEAAFRVCVTARVWEALGAPVLSLIPKAYILGIGCKKGKTARELEDAVREELHSWKIPFQSIGAVATIDLKRQETGLLEFCEKYNLDLFFYSAKELMEAPGTYECSEFVRSITGADNVCERAAVCRAIEERTGTFREGSRKPEAFEEVCQQPEAFREDWLLRGKTKKEGVTLALVKRDWSVEFE